MIKNRKAQTTIIVMITSLIILLMIGTSISYISSMGKRGNNILINRQLDELSEGAVYYGLAFYKKSIDYPTGIPISKQNFTIRESNASFLTNVNTYEPSNLAYNSEQKITFHEYGTFLDKEISLNQAKDVCFQITWDPDPISGQYASIRFEVEKQVTNADNTISYQSIRLPIDDNDGVMGDDPNNCNPSSVTSHLPIISSKLIFYKHNTSLPNVLRGDSGNFNLPLENTNDPNIQSTSYPLGVNNTMVNGYGVYRIKVTNTNGIPAPNLQTKGIYYRLSYRTFEINTDVEYGDYKKNNTTAIIQAYYNKNNITDVVPKFKVIKWIEGDE